MQETEADEMLVVVPKRKRGRPKKVREAVAFRTVAWPEGAMNPAETALAPFERLAVVNSSRGSPTEFNVLVRPIEIEEVTAGGIIKPQMAREREQAAAVEGQIVSISPLAFTYEVWPNGARKARAGDTVVFAKYAGMTWKGRDGVEYRILKDKDIALFID